MLAITDLVRALPDCDRIVHRHWATARETRSAGCGAGDRDNGGEEDRLNHIAHCHQESLPVNKTLNHFLGHIGSEAIADLRTQCVRRLIRNKVLDDCRLLGRFVVAVDGRGFLTFRERHCPHCLVHRDGSSVYYLHPVLEAKLVDLRGLALSVGTEFIENPRQLAGRAVPDLATLTEYETVKQDCVLKAFCYLLQIAHLFLQMFEMGSLLQQLAKAYGAAPPCPLPRPSRRLRDDLGYASDVVGDYPAPQGSSGRIDASS